mmetsp:Transcript_53648/g.138697  ORF Transcript_53648/g.138697 Transcript_53648/m.138697 type:complete len:304 (+) Transcript_53648:1-912(+)
MDVICGFTADCLAIDEMGDDTIACIGGNGDKAVVSLFSVGSGGSSTHLRGHEGQVCAVAVQGDVVASSSRDKTIRLWSRANGSCTAILKCDEQAYGLSLAGGQLLSGEGGQKGAKARLWSVSTGRLVAVYEGHLAPIWSVTLASDLAVTGSSDKSARAWRLGTCKDPFIGSMVHPAAVYSVDMPTNDADILATGCGDGQVRLWALANLACLRTLEHGGGFSTNAFLNAPVYAVRIYGGILISGGQDKTLQIWDLSKFGQSAIIATLPHGANVIGLAVSRHGMVVSASSKKLCVWAPHNTSSAS